MIGLRVLFMIAHYGDKNRAHLMSDMDGVRQKPFQVAILVLAGAPKSLGADVKVPSRHPWPIAMDAAFRLQVRAA